jgi:GLPGLI family protein
LLKYYYEKIIFLLFSFLWGNCIISAQEFQGKAFYFSKSKMNLGSWGARMSEAQKKQVKERLKNRLEKTYVLSFNTRESVFVEEDKIDAISGATDSWGANFARGEQYKDVRKTNWFRHKNFMVSVF